jgi:hypothetical protein
MCPPDSLHIVLGMDPNPSEVNNRPMSGPFSPNEYRRRQGPVSGLPD